MKTLELGQKVSIDGDEYIITALVYHSWRLRYDYTAQRISRLNRTIEFHFEDNGSVCIDYVIEDIIININQEAIVL